MLSTHNGIYISCGQEQLSRSQTTRNVTAHLGGGTHVVILFSLRPYCDGPIYEILDKDGNIVDNMTFDGIKDLYAGAAKVHTGQSVKSTAVCRGVRGQQKPRVNNMKLFVTLLTALSPHSRSPTTTDPTLSTMGSITLSRRTQPPWSRRPTSSPN